MRQDHVRWGKRSSRSWILFVVPVLGAACGSVPESVKVYAADLPARADGQYAFVSDDDIKKQLVLKDSELQCKIDVEAGKTEEQSAACKCTKSTGDWLVDCQPWLGVHTPKRPEPAASTSPAAPAPAPPGAPATPTTSDGTH